MGSEPTKIVKVVFPYFHCNVKCMIEEIIGSCTHNTRYQSPFTSVCQAVAGLIWRYDREWVKGWLCLRRGPLQYTVHRAGLHHSITTVSDGPAPAPAFWGCFHPSPVRVRPPLRSAGTQYLEALRHWEAMEATDGAGNGRQELVKVLWYT